MLRSINVPMCSMKLPNTYFETGSEVCCASIVTLSGSGTLSCACCALTDRHPSNAAARIAPHLFIIASDCIQLRGADSVPEWFEPLDGKINCPESISLCSPGG